MHIRLRRVIYINAIILFFVASPLLLFYISGYRFDLYQKAVRTTGSIFITTEPEDAEVFLNNDLIDTKTPLRLNHLTPNFYSIRIEKEHFQNYHKKLEVREKETTFLENIILWPESPERKNFISGEIKNFSIDPQERFILFQDTTAIKRYRITNGETTTILPLGNNTSTDAEIEWSEDGLRALINIDNQYLVYTVDGGIINISQQLKSLPKISKVKFGINASNKINFVSNKTLQSYDIQTKSIQKLLDEKISDYFYTNSILYVITDTQPVFLTTYTTAGEKNTLFQLPPADDYELVDIIKNQALVYTEDTKTMYFFTLDAEGFNNTSYFIQDIDAWEINEQKNTVLLHNTWEIWTYDIDSRESMLVTRFSKPIKQTKWYQDNNYIIISFSEEIQTIELDNRDYRNTAQLWQSNPIHDFDLSTNGEFLYLLADENNKQAIIKLTIFKPKSFLPELTGFID